MDAKKESTETPLIRVPYEALKRSVRDESKALQEEMARITQQMEVLQQEQRDKTIVVGELEDVSDRIQNLKRKVRARNVSEGKPEDRRADPQSNPRNRT
mmetsp:Transcript_6331/g.39490  ORF Transcript_6331/g.39490 Transcript_6331/m.39490 type:complete len:99 (+) Transcript_6331:98-394(+)